MMLVVTALLVWLAVLLIVAGLCWAAARGDAAQAAGPRRSGRFGRGPAIRLRARRIPTSGDRRPG